MMKFIPIFCLLLSGCANAVSTRFVYTNPTTGESISIEMPKECDAKDLKVSIDPATNKFEITASRWASRNADTIDAQANREANIINATGDVISKATAAAVKSALPIP